MIEEFGSTEVVPVVRSPDMEKTPGQIGYDAWQHIDIADRGVMECWDAAAAAIIEECAKIADGYAQIVKNHGHLPVDPFDASAQAAREIAAAIRAYSSPGDRTALTP